MASTIRSSRSEPRMFEERRFAVYSVPRHRYRFEEWSEWQDLNLRPPRPERVRLHESSMFIGKTDNVRGPLFSFGFVIPVGQLSG